MVTKKTDNEGGIKLNGFVAKAAINFAIPGIMAIIFIAVMLDNSKENRENINRLGEDYRAMQAEINQLNRKNDVQIVRLTALQEDILELKDELRNRRTGP